MERFLTDPFWNEKLIFHLKQHSAIGREQLRHHMQFVRDHSDVFITLYHSGIHQMVRDKFSILLPDTMSRWTEDPVEQQYRSAYIIAGVEAIERVWTERGFTESIDEVVEIIQRAHDRQVPLD